MTVDIDSESDIVLAGEVERNEKSSNMTNEPSEFDHLTNTQKQLMGASKVDREFKSVLVTNVCTQ